MTKLKPIKQFAEYVKEGDLVRIIFRGDIGRAIVGFFSSMNVTGHGLDAHHLVHLKSHFPSRGQNDEKEILFQYYNNYSIQEAGYEILRRK